MSMYCEASFGGSCEGAGPPRIETGSAATVMFSGGSDSTLVASLLAERFERVHLLTYKHRAMGFASKCLTSLDRLRSKHGADKFEHTFIDINPLMDRLFFRPLAGDLKDYGTYALPMCCGSCKLAMHVSTIMYNKARGIGYAADGSNVELSELFPEQMAGVLDLYRGLYRRFGVKYENPVFHVERSDHRLFELGVTDRREVKSEHVVYSNQHSCAAGVLLYGYTLSVSLPLLGRSSNKKLAERYIASKIENFCVPFLESELQCPAVD